MERRIKVMDIELEKLKKLEHALCDAIDILRDWQVEEAKPECPCADGIDSKACVGCEHSEDGKPEYKPYESVEEFIQDYQERFPTAVPRPTNTMPLIWLRRRTQEKIELAISFRGCEVQLGRGFWGMSELFEYWTYLDGTPVGMEVKE